MKQIGKNLVMFSATLLMLGIGGKVFAEADRSSTSSIIENTQTTVLATSDETTVMEEAREAESLSSTEVEAVAQTTELEESVTQTTESTQTPLQTSQETTTVTAVQAEQESGQTQGQAVIPIYRLYNPINGEHLYTRDANEKNVLYERHRWGY